MWILSVVFISNNCHSQTSTYCGKNASGSKHISDKELMVAFNKVGTLSGTYRLLNISKGKSISKRIKKLVMEV